MRFLNSLRLLIENFKNTFRLLICKLVVGIVATALCCAFVLPELIQIINSEPAQKFLACGKDFLSALLSADAAALETAKNGIIGESGALAGLAALLSSMTLEIVLAVVGCIVVYLLKRYADTLCHFAVGCTLHDKMSTYAETSFATALVANLGKGSAYALLYVPAVFVFDVATVLVCYLFLSILPILPAGFLCVTTIVACQSLKLSFTGKWMPAMTVDGMKLFEAICARAESGKKMTFKIFVSYVFAVYLIIIVNAIAAITTFGSALLVTVPASYMLLICIQYVNYYTANGKKYFITYESISVNANYGDREHFFDYIEDTAAETEEQTTKSEE